MTTDEAKAIVTEFAHLTDADLETMPLADLRKLAIAEYTLNEAGLPYRNVDYLEGA